MKILYHTLILWSLSLLLLTVIHSAHAQSVTDPTALNSIKVDTVEKQIYDKAERIVYYDYVHQVNPLDTFVTVKALCELRLGEHYIGWNDHYERERIHYLDSMTLAKATPMQMFARGMALTNKANYDDEYVEDKATNMLRFVMALTPYARFEYEEPIPKLSWTLTEGDSIIAGVACKRATTHFAGRDYIAWYGEDFPISYGPYKFRGLPGLIFCIHDTQRHNIFSLVGLEPSTSLIYLPNKPITATTKEATRRAYRNYCADPASALKNSGKTIKMSEEDWASIEPKPYNPIELE